MPAALPSWPGPGETLVYFSCPGPHGPGPAWAGFAPAAVHAAAGIRRIPGLGGEDRALTRAFVDMRVRDARGDTVAVRWEILVPAAGGPWTARRMASQGEPAGEGEDSGDVMFFAGAGPRRFTHAAAAAASPGASVCAADRSGAFMTFPP